MLSSFPLCQMMKPYHTQYRRETLVAISCTGICLLAEPNTTHNSCTLICVATTTAKKTTSVSIVRRRTTLLKPLVTASARCTNIHVSTSSLLHGARLLVSCGGMHKTSLPFVVTICLVTTICDIRFTKKENSSLLLAFIRSNCCQLPGRLATLFVIPFPHLLLVCDFKLFSWYWSRQYLLD